MSTRKPRDAAATAGDIANLSGLNTMADLVRQQMAVANEASCAMFRGFEEMRKIQQQAAHQAFTRHQAVSEKLQSKECGPMDAVSLEAGLLKDDMQCATQYWQQLAATAMEMQTEMMASAAHLLDSDAALESASVMEAFEGFPGMVKNFFPFPLQLPASAKR